MEFGPTAYVILGILGLGPHSGYDIKQLADLSTRHFWATSYGQIYPELKMLLKLFFADGMSSKETQRHLAAMVRRHQQTAAGLREHEGLAKGQPHRMKYEVMKFGIAFHEWCADWFGRLAKDVEAGKEAKK
jgi:DNA-binding PadR family transcriptional regulator